MSNNPYKRGPVSAPSGRIKARTKVIVPLVLLLAISGLFGDRTNIGQRFLSEIRRLCDGYFRFGTWANLPETYWEELYKDVNNYIATDRDYPPYDPTNIGYALTLMSCPEDDYQPGVDTQFDPGHAFYDAAAVLKYSICHQTYPTGSDYNSTMYAIVHPDAIRCSGPNGETYDRVKVLTDLGYHVLIHGDPIATKDIQDPAVRDNVYDDAGLRDLMKLYAFKFDHHPAVVMVDFRTLMVDSIDTHLDQFIASDKQVMYTTHYPTSDDPTGRNRAAKTSWFMLKPDPNVLADIVDTYKTTSFNPDTSNHHTAGWDSSGVGDFPKQYGTDGILHYYYNTLNPDQIWKTDRCQLGNDNSDPMKVDSSGNVVCRDPYTCQDCRTYSMDTIQVAEMITVCGEPWKCYYDDNWDSNTKPLCEEFHRRWFATRIQYEDSHWHGGPPTDRSGTYKSDVFLGFCHTDGIVGYDRMIDDKLAPASCDANTVTTEAVSTLHFLGGKTQEQIIKLEAGETTASTTACVSGSVTKVGREQPYNIGIVIDVSGSTGGGFGGTPVGDVNGDGNSDTILDAEIASIIEVMDFIAAAADLGNYNVDIGLVSFSTEATYHGRFQPSDPSDPTQANPALVAELEAMRSGGYTHFDDALDKVIEYFQEAPTDRTNLLFFLSDGIPNVPGDGDNEEPVGYQNNVPAALMYDSELAILDQYDVQRMAIGVGSGSDIREGYGLDMIDNTPDDVTGETAIQVTSSDELTDALLSNPIVGQVMNFQLSVNGVQQPQVDLSTVKSGPTGFSFGQFIVSGLNPEKGSLNTVTAKMTMDFDGDESTVDDQHVLTTSNDIIGTLF